MMNLSPALRNMAVASHAVFVAFIPVDSVLADEALPETVISASRTRELLKDTPYAVSVIGEDDLLDGAVRTVPDALRDSPGVMIQKTSHSQGSPFIRGFTGRHNLLLVDGIRINNGTFRSGPVQYWNTVDAGAVDRFELIKGQGSVLYGSDAIGGTLNTLTKSSNFRDQQAGWFNQNSAFYRFDTNSRSHVGRLETKFGIGEKWGVILGVTSKDFGDIRDSAVGRMKHTGYSELDLDFRLDAALSDATTLTLAHHRVDQDDAWRWHSTVFNSGWSHDGHVTTPGNFPARVLDQERTLSYLKLAGGEGEGFLKAWSATLSYQTSQDSQFQDRKPTDIRHQNIDTTTWGFAAQMESEIGPGSLVYGLDYYRDEVDSRGSRTGRDPRSQRPIADDASYDLLGLFAQYRWSPLRSLPKLRTTFGARYTYADAHLGKVWDGANGTDTSADMDWDNFVFSARALYDLNDCWNIYGGISQGFRAPNLNDLSGNLTSRSGMTSLGSLGLEPEEFISYELGARYEGDSVGVSIAAYYTDIKRVITGVPATAGSSTSITTNGQDGHTYGVGMEGHWQISDQWKLSAQASWQDGQSEEATFLGGPVQEDDVSRVAPLMGSVSLRWTHSNEKFWIEGKVRAAATADKLSAGDKRDSQRIPSGGTPSYIIPSIYAGWQATDSLLVTLAVENLTDEDYRIHGSGQNEPGVNAILGLKYDF